MVKDYCDKTKKLIRPLKNRITVDKGK
jgi:hypothetical protein